MFIPLFVSCIIGFELALLFVKQHVDNNPYAATKEQIDLLNLNQKIHEEVQENDYDRI